MARPVVVVLLLLLLLAACISLTTARRRAFHRTLGKTHKKSIESQFVTSPAPDGDNKDDDLGFFRLSFRKKPKGSPQITIRLSNGTDVFPPGTGQLSSKEGLTIDLQNLET